MDGGDEGFDHAGTSEDDGGDYLDREEEEAPLREALQLAVGDICEESGSMNMTGAAVATIAEMCWQLSSHIAAELPCFARHAKRSSINKEDVKLLTRKSDGLRVKLEKFEREHAALKQAGKKRKSRAGDEEADDIITRAPPPASSEKKGKGKGKGKSKRSTDLLEDDDFY